MRKFTRAATGAALGLVLTSTGFVTAASAATAGPDLPAIPGATAENPVGASSTGIFTIQGAESVGDRGGLPVFETGLATPGLVATSSIEGGTLKVVDQRGRLLCEGTATPALPKRYSCDLAPLSSGPQVVTAAVVRSDGSYSTPSQAHLDAFAAVPVVDSAERRGDDLVVRGRANAGATIEASFDRRDVVTSTPPRTDASFEIVVPGGAAAEHVWLRSVDQSVPLDTPDRDAFTQSNWADARAGDGGEQPGGGNEGEQPGGGDQPGGGGDQGEQPGDQDVVGTVTSLRDGDTVHTARPTIEGTAPAGTHVSVGGPAGPALGAATADEHGNWKVTLEGALDTGQNQLVFRYQQADGSWLRGQSLDVTYEQQAQRFEITTPASGSTVHEARPTITGHTPGSYRNVSIVDPDAGEYLGDAKTDADGAFTLPLERDLRPGVNELVASYQDETGKYRTSPWTITYSAGDTEQPGDGEQPGEGTEQPGAGNEGGEPGGGDEGGEPGDGGSEQPGDGASDAAFTLGSTRIDHGRVSVDVRGPAGTEVTVTANGERKVVTLDDEEFRNVVVTAPEQLTTTVTATATIDGERVERTLTIGNGDHDASALEATVTSTSALTGSAEITVWGLPSGIGGLQAHEGDRQLAVGSIGADGRGKLSLTGLAKGDHVITITSGGKSVQLPVHV